MDTENLSHYRAALRRIYELRGVMPAIGYLNSLTEHRFTALFRFQGDTLCQAYLFDRVNPNAPPLADIPVETSYCVYVRNTGRAFATADSLNDPRVKDHPKRKEVQSYCGVPVVDSNGRLFGSLCHFDFLPRPDRPESIELLDYMANLLQDDLHNKSEKGESAEP